MSKIMRLMVMSILLLSVSSVAQAWNVTVENKSPLGNITATVYSGSYYNKKEEFTKTVPQDGQITGSLSGGLCMAAIKINMCTWMGAYKCEETQHVWFETTRCANTVVTVEQKKSTDYRDCDPYPNQYSCEVRTKIFFKSPGLIDDTIYFKRYERSSRY